MTSSTSWICNDPEFINNQILALAPAAPYQIPAMASLGDRFTQVGFDVHDSIQRVVEVGTDMQDGRVAGRLLEVCSTETQAVFTRPRASRAAVRVLAFHYDISTLVVDPSYGMEEDINRILPEVRDTNSKQMERCLYRGYSGVPLLQAVEGLNGFKDIGVDESPAAPIDPADYSALSRFFVGGINSVRKGGATGDGYEFLHSDIEVHVGQTVVDQINFSVLANTAIDLWQKMQESALSRVAAVVVSEQIGNEVYFINRKRVRGLDNGRLRLAQKKDSPFPMKERYVMLAGTPSVWGQNTKPVVYATDVVLTT